MNAVMAISRQTKRVAGLAALAATLFTTAGTLTLAEHYARTGKAEQAQIAGNPAVRYAASPSLRHTGYGQAANQS